MTDKELYKATFAHLRASGSGTRQEERRMKHDAAVIYEQRQRGQVHALAERGRKYDRGNAVEHGFCDQNGRIAVQAVLK